MMDYRIRNAYMRVLMNGYRIYWNELYDIPMILLSPIMKVF